MALGTLTREYSYRNGGDGQPRRGRGGVELELADYVGLDAGELVKLIFQADSAKRQLEGYLVGLLGCFGELMGEDAVEDLCRQFGLSRRRATRTQARQDIALWISTWYNQHRLHSAIGMVPPIEYEHTHIPNPQNQPLHD